MIDIEIQNETQQTELRIKALAVPRIGEGIRLKEPSGDWASYDVLDVWYQKADYGEVWVPYLHVRATPEPGGYAHAADPATARLDQSMPIEQFLAKFEGDRDHETVKLNLDLTEDG